RRLASSSVAWRKACMRPPLGRRIQGPNSISACQIWLLNSASNFLCAWGASSCRSERPRCLRKRYSVEGEMAGASLPEDRASSRNSVVPDPEGTPMRVFALEAFDQAGQLRGDGARLAPVL